MKKVLPAKPDTPINDIIRSAVEATDSRDADIIADEAFMLTPDEDMPGYYLKLLRDRASTYLSANKRALAKEARNLDEDEDDDEEEDEEEDEEVQVKTKVTRRTKKTTVSKTRPVSPRVARRRKWWNDMQKTRIIGVEGKPKDFAFATAADFRASSETSIEVGNGHYKTAEDYTFIADLMDKHGIGVAGDLPIKLQEQVRIQFGKST